MHDRQRGFITVFVIVLLVIIGFLAVSYSMAHRNLIREAAAAKWIDDSKSLQKWFKTGHSCTRTMTANPGACGTGHIDLGRVGTGTPPLLVDFTSPSTFAPAVGAYRIRAKCTGNATKTLTIEVQPLKENPTSGAWKNLFPAEVISCS